MNWLLMIPCLVLSSARIRSGGAPSLLDPVLIKKPLHAATPLIDKHCGIDRVIAMLADVAASGLDHARALA